MKAMLMFLSVAIAGSLLTSGCNSIAYRRATPEQRANFLARPGPYPAVRHDAYGAGMGLAEMVGGGPLGLVFGAAYLPIALGCLPFDAVVDTVCLPYDCFQIGNTNFAALRQ